MSAIEKVLIEMYLENIGPDLILLVFLSFFKKWLKLRDYFEILPIFGSIKLSSMQFYY